MSDNKIWVIDTETSNNGIWKPEPGGHIVEFGMVEVDLDRGKFGRNYSAIVCEFSVYFVSDDPQVVFFSDVSD